MGANVRHVNNRNKQRDQTLQPEAHGLCNERHVWFELPNSLVHTAITEQPVEARRRDGPYSPIMVSLIAACLHAPPCFKHAS